MAININFLPLLLQLESQRGGMKSGSNEPPETEKTLKLKLCLYLESLFASMEVGAAL
jgi:hypothetical protein